MDPKGATALALATNSEPIEDHVLNFYWAANRRTDWPIPVRSKGICDATRTICPECLDADVARNVPLHIRSRWTHPFATICMTHMRPLASAEWPPEGDWAAWPRSWRKLQPHEDVSLLLDLQESSPDLDAAAAQSVALLDLIDALMTRTGVFGIPGPIAIAFDQYNKSFLPGPGSERLPEHGLWDLEERDRLSLVRLGAQLLAEPKDPRDEGAIVWDHRVKNWGRSDLSIALLSAGFFPDPMNELGIQLSPWNKRALADRSRAWPTRLRDRFEQALELGKRVGLTR